MKKIIFIVGATSSGKSLVAADLAKRADGEVISCDSMQVYKDMDVITRPPDDDILYRVSHHLIKVISPEEEYNAARFADESSYIIDSIVSKGKMPIVVGGTGLYMKALVDGIFSAPSKDEELRNDLNGIAEKRGVEHLYDQLKECDPETASKLHPNDKRRIIRALEVYSLMGRTIHQEKMEAEGISSRYDCMIFGMKLPRNVLYERINVNVESIFEEGIIETVKELVKRPLSLTARKALGIKEVDAFLRGNLTLDETKEELKKNTRRYAKRQLTWFRGDRRIVWIDANRDVGFIVEDILRQI
jgi:tRNA dimethylallyltransferase